MGPAAVLILSLLFMYGVGTGRLQQLIAAFTNPVKPAKDSPTGTTQETDPSAGNKPLAKVIDDREKKIPL